MRNQHSVEVAGDQILEVLLAARDGRGVAVGCQHLLSQGIEPQAAAHDLLAEGRLPTGVTGIHMRSQFAVLKHLLGHRRQRETQVMRAIGEGLVTIPQMVAAMYAMVDKRLHPAAGRSVLAHLIDLERRGKVARAGESWSIV